MIARFSQSALTPTSTPIPTLTTTPAPTNIVLAAEERTVAPNGTTSVPIRLEKAIQVGSLNFSLRYDTSVVKVNQVEAGDLAGGALFQASTRDAGIIRFGVAAQGTEGISGDGPLAHVQFTAMGPRGTQSALSLGDLLVTDTRGVSLSLNLRNGRVIIESRLKADYDGDGKITAKDALAALKM